MTEYRKEFWVRCTLCTHVWMAAKLPMEAQRFAGLAQGMHCPACGGSSASVFVATEADINAAIEKGKIMDEQQPSPAAAEPQQFEWAVVEVFGHRSHAGRTREEERFGCKMLRIDVPRSGDPAGNGWETFYYGGSAIFSFRLTDEASVMRANRPWAPPSRTTLPAPHYDVDNDDLEEPFVDPDDEPALPFSPETP